ncbi:MAG: Holliday junction resolvase RuvX [Candidatus Melainabacteria bacterium HGW-Melainabacteria-1]|nr:MAG: Holliday junction resolvase RuvX [Candidatus Melainabacteria bacterium HGW-Melainabacteria-1]
MFQESPRAMGLDIGTKTIGIAVSDRLGWTARPTCTIRRQGWVADLAALRELVAEHGIRCLVAGLPLGCDGEMTEQARFNQRAAERIQLELDLPLSYVDESHSSVDARDLLQEMGVSRKKRRQISIDQQAAALILQEYLDQQQRLEQARIFQQRQQERQQD